MITPPAQISGAGNTLHAKGASQLPSCAQKGCHSSYHLLIPSPCLCDLKDMLTCWLHVWTKCKKTTFAIHLMSLPGSSVHVGFDL